ncbi:hypothetical protein ONE63_008185 [Megalurothrips usitatus]|uniref:Uncharacterized protein n=1 Tax=Megalurothrips usitatus TaxID=439358 RepID=A0AAV7XPH6_9NEOP|nr:hypothetical protein ONE63_008185 [Megalurothrips usitatus]
MCTCLDYFLPTFLAARTTSDGACLRLKGPFRIVPDHIEHCPDSFFKEELAHWTFRGVRDRHNVDVWYYHGNYTLGFYFDDSLNVELNVGSWSSRGGWKENAHVLKFKKICTTGKTYVSRVWQNIMDSVYDENNRTRPDCPFPKGKYRLVDCKADLSTARAVPAFFYGKWRADFKIVDSNWSCISCMRIFANTVPLTVHGSQFGAAGGASMQSK